MQIAFHVFVALILGAASVQVISYHDEINGSETFRMQGNRIGPDRNTDISLDAQCVVSKEGEESWSLIVRYEDCLRSNKDVLDLLAVESGETLILQIDGTRIGLKGAGSGGRQGRHPNGQAQGVESTADSGVETGSHGQGKTNACVSESVVYDVTLDKLHQIANGEIGTAKLIGTRDSVESEFTQSNFHNLKTFLHQHSQHEH